jgi:hypothetical protein
METRNRCQGINSASLCSLAGRYDNPIPTQCLAPIDFLKIPALGDGDKGIEIVYGEEKNILYCAEAAKAEQKYPCMYWQGKPNEPTKEGPLSFVLFESPFTSVSTVSRGYPSLVSLVASKGIGPDTTLAWPGWKQPDIQSGSGQGPT